MERTTREGEAMAKEQRKRVVIWVKGGCATVIRQPSDVNVVIVDKDCGETETFVATRESR